MGMVSIAPVPASSTTTHSLDSLLKKAATAAHSIDVALKKAVATAHSADTLLKKTVSSAHTIDAYIQQPTPTISHTISSYLFKERPQLSKILLARISNSSGAFLTTWKNIDFRGYTTQLNGGPSECIIDYAVPFDYDGADLREGNDVELVISDADTQLTNIEDGTYGAKPIYRGYISLVERTIDGTSERVRVHLLGYYTLLALDVLKSSSQTTLYSVDPAGLTTTSGDLEPADVGLMARTVIDRFNAEHGTGKVFYDTADVPDTGTDATYVFNQKTYREALDILKSLAPANVYWYVDETGRFSFKEPSSTPDHRFIFGRHFSRVYVERSLEKVRNVVLIWDGDTTYKQYTDPASVALYGRRTERINDYGISNNDAADALGAKFLAENKDPGLKLICTIIDNNNAQGLGYDIESIRPGDTCALQGFSSTLSDIFRDNMLITRLQYRLDSVDIEVELTKSGLVDVQARQSREIADIGSGGLGIPATYS